MQETNDSDRAKTTESLDKEYAKAIDDIVKEGDKIVNDLGSLVYQHVSNSILLNISIDMYDEMQKAHFVRCKQSKILDEGTLALYENEINEYIEYIYSFLPPDGNALSIVKSLVQEHEIQPEEVINRLNEITEEMLDLEKEYVKTYAKLYVFALFMDRGKTEKVYTELNGCYTKFTNLVLDIVNTYCQYVQKEAEANPVDTILMSLAKFASGESWF